MYSATKYMNGKNKYKNRYKPFIKLKIWLIKVRIFCTIPGHTDVVMGLISLNRGDLYERLKFLQSGKALPNLNRNLLKFIFDNLSDDILIFSKQLFSLWHDFDSVEIKPNYWTLLTIENKWLALYKEIKYIGPMHIFQ